MNPIKTIRDDLLNWYDVHARFMPWRNDPTPWHVWVSEIMLQQTRVESVFDYFQRFIARFPSPRAVAEAPVEDVLDMWAGLGYYSRARNLHHACREIVADHEGQIPADAKTFGRLKGVGRYTCGAVMSIAFQQSEPIVDGNVERVFSRLFFIEEDTKLTATKKRFWALAHEWVADLDVGQRPGDANQALMELGALICLPKAPKCDFCPAKAHCEARRLGKPERLPVKSKSAPKKLFKKTASLCRDNANRIWMVRRPENGVLAGLWALPMVDIESEDFALELQPKVRIKHAFTHQVWQVDLIEVDRRIDEAPPEWGPSARAMTEDELSRIAVGGPSLKALIKAGVSLPKRRGAG